MRRGTLGTLGTLAALCLGGQTLLWLPGAAAIAAELAATPAQPRGPFYPNTLPAESDPDLALYAGASAQGEPLVVSGRVLGRDGRPIANARVEIWQTNARGRYHHEGDASPAPLDPGFQGWGRTETGADGGYRFRTIRPLAYSGRTPHIHFAVTAPGARAFYTQMYFAGAPENRDDFLVRRLSEAERARITVAPAKEAGAAEPVARFDIVLP
jgi:protocatechuate 3,4-dioxygenase beta subunit